MSMNIIAHAGHDHSEELANTVGSTQTLIAAFAVVAILAIAVPVVIFIRRKK